MQSKRPQLHVTGSEQQHYIAALKVKSGWTAFWQQGGKIVAGKWGFFGYWTAWKGRDHKWEAADGFWACPVTVTERKCDRLSGFYQSWAEFVPASSMVRFCFSTLAGVFLAQQRHWPVQATASQPDLCLWPCSSLSHPKDALCRSCHIPSSVSDPKTRWGAGERQYESCCPELCCLWVALQNPWLWMFEWQATVLTVKCWLVSDSGRPFKYELLQCVTWWRN